MTTVAGNKTTLSANGTSGWVKIPKRPEGPHPRIIVGNASNTWGVSTAVAIELTGDPTADSPIPTPLLESDNETAVSFTENGHRVIQRIHGAARMVVTDYSGSAELTLQIV